MTTARQSSVLTADIVSVHPEGRHWAYAICMSDCQSSILVQRILYPKLYLLNYVIAIVSVDWWISSKWISHQFRLLPPPHPQPLVLCWWWPNNLVRLSTNLHLSQSSVHLCPFLLTYSPQCRQTH